MVNLKVTRFVVGATYSATRPAKINQSLLEFLGPRFTSTESSGFDFFEIAESVCGDFSAVRSGYEEGFQRYALFPNVARCSWWVIIPVSIAQFFSRDMAVLQNVVDDCLGALCCHGLQAFEQFFREFALLSVFFLCHRLDPYQSAS